MFVSSMKRQRERGQSIVILAGGILSMLAMVGLVIDGGNGYAQQRRAQNGMDAAAEAGAVELARRMMGIDPVSGDAAWDARVEAAVQATAANNGLAIPTDPLDPAHPEYTDYLGNRLGAKVGDGVIPASAQGVIAGGSLTFSTYFVGVLGAPSFTASAEATAVTGFAVDSGFGNVIPLTIPVILTQCETGGGSDRLNHPLGNAPAGEWPTGPANMIAIPLCSNGPGNIGWIDWTPTAGGASEVGASIRNPNNPPITTPHWYYIAELGGMTSLDDDMDTLEGTDILIPIYDAHANDPATPADESYLGTCDATPTGTRLSFLTAQLAKRGSMAGRVGVFGYVWKVPSRALLHPAQPRVGVQ